MSIIRATIPNKINMNTDCATDAMVKLISLANGYNHLIPIKVGHNFHDTMVSDGHRYFFMIERSAIFRVDVHDMSKRELWCNLERDRRSYDTLEYYHPYIYIQHYNDYGAEQDIYMIDTRQAQQIKKITLRADFDIVRGMWVCSNQLILAVNTPYEDNLIICYDLNTNSIINEICSVPRRDMQVHDGNLIFFGSDNLIYQVTLKKKSTNGATITPYSKSKFVPLVSNESDVWKMVHVHGDRIIYLKNDHHDMHMLNIGTGDDVLIATDFCTEQVTIIGDNLYAVVTDSTHDDVPELTEEEIEERDAIWLSNQESQEWS